MKKTPNAFARLVGLLLVSATVLTLTVAATGGAGTSSDPLVTLSYLNEKFLPQVLSDVDKKTASREKDLSSKLTEQVKNETKAFEQKYGTSTGSSGSTASSFTVVTLSKGQTLSMGIGCEAMLRTGSGVCVASSDPGLVDETGRRSDRRRRNARTQNHLYMATLKGHGVQAGANSTKLLVRGSYSVQDNIMTSACA
ncbi:MAG: hypothetical protein V8T17_07900 [Oscillospiraceae bacterium]